MSVTSVKPLAEIRPPPSDLTDIVTSVGERVLNISIPAIVTAVSNRLLGTIIAEPARKSRSRTTSSNRPRHHLSAVPDSAVLMPIRRPAEYGRKGKPLEIYTNHFPVAIDDISNIIINQYEIAIARIRQDGKHYFTQGKERWEVLQQFVKANSDFPVFW